MVITIPFFDVSTSSFSYVVFDPQSKDAIIIDPVLDYDPTSATISMNSIKLLQKYIREQNLRIRMIMDTHVHADHMSAAFFIKHIFEVPSAIGENFLISQRYFADFFGLTSEVNEKKAAYDILLKHNQVLEAGSLSIRVILTPGHTPSCASFLIDDALFCGDALFQPERGCGRTDFAGASASVLYRSIKNYIYTLPDATKLFVGHDYPALQEKPRPKSSVGLSKRKNILLDEHTSEASFVQNRTLRDQNLQPPKLLLPALQINILGGQLPRPNAQGQRFLRQALTLLE